MTRTMSKRQGGRAVSKLVNNGPLNQQRRNRRVYMLMNRNGEKDREEVLRRKDEEEQARTTRLKTFLPTPEFKLLFDATTDSVTAL